MERLDELLFNLEGLPDGYISRKTIKGKVYSYLQYFSKGKIISKYVPAENLADLEAKLAERKAIEEEVKKYLPEGYIPMPKLTKREKELTGNIMCGNKPVAKIYKGTVVSFDKQRCPLALLKNKDARVFFKARTVNTGRTNVRELLHALDIKEKDESIIPLYVNGRSLIDNYWFRPSGAVTKFEELKFGKNLYAAVSFDGLRREYPINRTRTPEITTTGMFEKCWKFENGSWWLYKKENEEEVFSEIFTCYLAKSLEILSITPVKFENGVKVKNFAEKFNFDPLAGYVENADDLVAGYDAVKVFGKEIAMEYVKIRYLDALTYNVDRTLNDIGVLRNKETGQVVAMAPNFDNNCCLTAIMPRLDTAPENDSIIKNFLSFVTARKDIKRTFRKCKFPKLKKEMLKKLILKASPYRQDFKEIIDFITIRMAYIKRNKNRKVAN